MKVLALDTSSKNASVAVLDGQTVLKEMYNESEKEHSENLLTMIKKTFDDLNMTLDDIDLLSCGIGPGSFTGIRVGIATAKAFADVKKIPVVGINSLESQAYSVVIKEGKNDCKILSLIDAKNENAYFAVYRVHDGNMSVYKNPDIMHIADTIEYINFQEKVYIVGDIPKEKLEAIIRARISKEIAQGRSICEYEFVSRNKCTAVAIARSARNRYRRGIYGDSNSLAPMYLRRPQAEREKMNDHDERLYLLEMINKDAEEIKEHYDQFPNLWGLEEFENDEKNSKYFVAKRNNEIIGFVSYRTILDEIEIMNLVTRQDKRNQGVASNLLSYIIRKEKPNKINLEVNEHNITAINLYSKFGFKQVGMRTRYYDGKDDAILMTL